MFRGVKQLFAAIVCGVTLTVLVPVPRLSAAVPTQPTQPLASFPVQGGLPNPNDIFDAVNRARIEKGLPVLQKDAALTRIAQERAADMKQRAYYGHKNPDGLLYYDLLFQHQIGVNYSCENLDLQFSATAADYVSDWMNSNKGHRECMLNAATDRAGYAITTIDTGSYTNNEIPTYVVVAIHATSN